MNDRTKRIFNKLYISLQALLIVTAGIWLPVGTAIYFHDVHVIEKMNKCLSASMDTGSTMRPVFYEGRYVENISNKCAARASGYIEEWSDEANLGATEKVFKADTLNFYSKDVWGDNYPSLLAYTIAPILFVALSSLTFGIRRWLIWLIK